MSAIGAVFDRSTKPLCPPLYVGTVKPNIGHLEAGAGLAGIIKTVLSLEAGVIPPNINFQNPNPKLRLEKYHFAVPTQPTPWPTHGLRRASVNSFGYGGTNGHCILDDAFHYLSARGLYGRTHIVDMAPQLSLTSEATDSGIDSASEGDGFDLDHPSEKDLPAQQKVFVLSAPEQNALPRLAETHSAFLKDRLSSQVSQIDDIFRGSCLYTQQSSQYLPLAHCCPGWECQKTGNSASQSSQAYSRQQVPKPTVLLQWSGCTVVRYGS